MALLPRPLLLLATLRHAGAVLPLANFSTVPASSWCGNQSGPLSPAAVRAFAGRAFAVFEKDMSQSAAPVGQLEELKIAREAERVRVRPLPPPASQLCGDLCCLLGRRRPPRCGRARPSRK
jgi:hypothetical protein